MSAESNKRIVERYFEQVYNQGNDALIHELFAPDFKDESNPHLEAHGLQAVKHVVDFERFVLPDIHVMVEDMLAEGDDVIVRLTIRGTHQGEYRGVAPTGRPVQITGVECFHFVNSRISRLKWHYFDKFTLLAQMGAVEAR